MCALLSSQASSLTQGTFPSLSPSQPLELSVPGVPRHFPVHSKENKNQQLSSRAGISNMCLSTCFFEVLGAFFPSGGRQELLTQRAPTPSESHSAFLTRMFPAASFPQAAGIFLLTLQCSLSLLSLSTPPGWSSGHAQSDTLQQGSPALLGFTPQGFLQPNPAPGCVSHRDFAVPWLAQSPAGL